MEFADVSGSEPLSAILLEKVLFRFIWYFVVASGDVVTADKDLASGTRNVRHSVVCFLPIFQSNIAYYRRRSYSSRTTVVSCDG